MPITERQFKVPRLPRELLAPPAAGSAAMLDQQSLTVGPRRLGIARAAIVKAVNAPFLRCAVLEAVQRIAKEYLSASFLASGRVFVESLLRAR